MNTAARTILDVFFRNHPVLVSVVRTPRNGSARLCLVLDFWLSLSKGARKEGREEGACSVGVTKHGPR